MTSDNSIGMCTVVAVDMWNSSAHWANSMVNTTAEAIEDHNKRVDAVFERARPSPGEGSAFASAFLGDGRLFVFDRDSTAAASSFVASIKDEFSDEEATSTTIGIAAGDVKMTSDTEGHPEAGAEYSGRAIEVAARLTAIAYPGQVLAEDTIDSDVFSEAELRSVPRESVNVRLPGTGPWTDWPLVKVFQVLSPSETDPLPIKNGRASREQALRCRKLVEAALKTISEFSPQPQVAEFMVDFFAECPMMDGIGLSRLHDGLAYWIGSGSALDILNKRWLDFEELTRTPDLSSRMTLIRGVLTELQADQMSVFDTDGDAASHDATTRKAFCHKINRYRAHLHSWLMGLHASLSLNIEDPEDAGLRENPEPADSRTQLVAS